LQIITAQTKGQIISEKYWYYFHCPKKGLCSEALYFEFTRPWTRLLLKLIDSGIHFKMRKEKMVSSGVEREPLVTLFFLTQFQNLFFRIVFGTFFGQ
jgi:hypothetical protein